MRRREGLVAGSSKKAAYFTGIAAFLTFLTLTFSTLAGVTDRDRFPANVVGIPAWWATAMHNSIQRNAVVWADGILRRLSLSRMSFETRGSSHKQG